MFLSDVKNAIEVDRRVHGEALPPSAEEQTALARRLGYEEYPRQALHGRLPADHAPSRRAMERVFTEAVS